MLNLQNWRQKKDSQRNNSEILAHKVQSWNRTGRPVPDRPVRSNFSDRPVFTGFLPVFFQFLKIFEGTKTCLFCSFLTVFMISFIKGYDPGSFQLINFHSLSKFQLYILLTLSYPRMRALEHVGWILLCSWKISEVLEINIGWNYRFFTSKFWAHFSGLILANSHRITIASSFQVMLS